MLLQTYTKLLAIFDRRDRRRFFLLCMLMMAMGIVETIGIAAVLPFLAVVARPSSIEENPLLSALYTYSGLGDTNDFLVWLGIGVFALYMLSVAMKTLTSYGIARFAAMRGFHISTRLMARNLRQPYAWYLQHNSADLAKMVLDEATQLVHRTIMPSLEVLKGTILALFLVTLVFIMDPVVAIVAALALGAAYGLIYRLAQAYLGRIGEENRTAIGLRYRLVQEAFGGIKEIKTLGIETQYAARFVGPSYRTAQINALQRIIGELPRFLLEAVVFAGLLTLVLVKLLQDDGDFAALVPTLGIYAFAGARLFPAMQLIYQQLAAIRFSQPLLDAIHAELTAPVDDRQPVRAGQAAIRLQHAIALSDVRYRYPGADRAALDGVSLTIPAGRSVAFVGGTGAGKTTAIDVIMGLLVPQGGTICVDGVPIDASTSAAWQRSIGYVPQQIYLADATIAENIAFGQAPERIDRDAVLRAARIAELHSFITASLDKGYETVVGERGVRLSGGQRQRIGIARALYHDPDVLVLDEATSALDTLTEHAFMDTLRNLGRAKTVIIIAHRLSTVEHCDTIFLMEHGRLLDQGSYGALIEHNDLFRRMANVAAA